MNDGQGAMLGGLIGLVVVAVVVVVLGVTPIVLFPLVVVGAWMAILLVRGSRA